MKKLALLLLLFISGFVASAQTADDHFKNGDYAKSATAYAELVKNDTTNVIAMRRLAFSYSNLENTGALVEHWYKKALAQDPNDVASNYYLGMYYKERLNTVKTSFKQDYIAKAKTYLNNAVKLGSEDAKSELKELK